MESLKCVAVRSAELAAADKTAVAEPRLAPICSFGNGRARSRLAVCGGMARDRACVVVRDLLQWLFLGDWPSMALLQVQPGHHHLARPLRPLSRQSRRATGRQSLPAMSLLLVMEARLALVGPRRAMIPSWRLLLLSRCRRPRLMVSRSTLWETMAW